MLSDMSCGRARIRCRALIPTLKEANLHWADGDRLVFLAYLDDWPHLYSVAAAGGAPTLLTPGHFMVEHVTETRDRRFMIYDANTGTTAGTAIGATCSGCPSTMPARKH
jgi:hypothetical protein